MAEVLIVYLPGILMPAAALLLALALELIDSNLFAKDDSE